MRTRLQQLRSEEGGFALVEVMISSLIVVLVTAAVIQTLTATGRASTEERHRSQAFSVAQEDQARLRAMQIATLQQNLAPRTVTVDGTPFTVKSTAVYVSSKTGRTQCGTEGRADYIRIGSSVTWPTMREGADPVTIESIDSPTTGSVDTKAGGIAITVNNSRIDPRTLEPVHLSGVGISGTGPATFSGSTNSEGCALFGGQPIGKYTITPTLPGSDWVDPNGEAPKSFPVPVYGGSTATEELFYDHAGTLKAEFVARPRTGGEPIPATADSLIVYRSETGVKTFGTVETTPQPSITTTSLYPFESKYSVWAGSCVSTPLEEAAKPAVKLEPGEKGKVVVVPLPALYLNVTRQPATNKPFVAASGAVVTLTDQACKNAKGNLVVRKFKTTSTGWLGENTTGVPTKEVFGVPGGEYKICASAEGRRVIEKLTVDKLSGTALNLKISATAELGGCPA